MADPSVIQCAGACTVTVVHQLQIPFLELSVEQGQEIAGVILLAWATGWLFRHLARQISKSGENHESD